jgi:hypothetical protein
LGWDTTQSAVIVEVGDRIVYLSTATGEILTSFSIAAINWDDYLPYGPPNPNANWYQLSADGQRIYFIAPTAVMVYDAHTGNLLQTLSD